MVRRLVLPEPSLCLEVMPTLRQLEYKAWKSPEGVHHSFPRSFMLRPPWACGPG